MDNVFKTKHVQISELDPESLYNLINKAVDDAVKTAVKMAVKPLSDDIKSLVDIKIYTTKEAAVMLKISEQTVIKYLKKQVIKNHKQGYNYIITHENLMQFINGKK